MSKGMPQSVMDELQGLHSLYRNKRTVALSAVNSMETRTDAARMAKKYLKDAEKAH